jgi:hypothetical protein
MQKPYLYKFYFTVSSFFRQIFDLVCKKYVIDIFVIVLPVSTLKYSVN